MRPILTLLLLFCGGVQATTSPIVDSLKLVYASPDHSIAERYEACRGLFNYYCSFQLDSALIYCNAVVGLAEQSGDTTMLINSYHDAGKIGILRGEFGTTIPNLDKALQFSLVTASDTNVAYTYQLLGLAWAGLAEFEQSIQYHLKAIETWEKAQDTSLILACMSNLGSTYVNSDRHHLAEKYFRDAIEMGKTVNDSHSLGTAYQNLGIVLANQNRNEEAIEALETALSFYEKPEKLLFAGPDPGSHWRNLFTIGRLGQGKSL